MTDLAALVAAHQRERLARALARTQRPAASLPKASRWAYVPLAALFTLYGNTVYGSGQGRAECGHEPVHSSKSGRCVLLDLAAGRWWCRSCQQHGDAATFIATARGCDQAEAAAWLTERYGPPADDRTARRRRGRIAWRRL